MMLIPGGVTIAFEVVIPFEKLRDSANPGLRVFAVTETFASELEYGPGFPYLARPSSTE